MAMIQFDQYEVLRPLRAIDQAHCRPHVYLIKKINPLNREDDYLVLKCLDSQAPDSQQALFQNEIKFLTQLNQHCNDDIEIHFIRLTDSGVFETKDSIMQQQGIFFLMPYYKRGNVADFLKERFFKGRPFEQHEIKNLFQKMLHSVKRLHEIGYVHLDLKPSNFLISHSQEQHLLLSDFSLAKATAFKAKPIFNQMIEQASSMVQGTPRYMSPEQFLGLPCSQQSDFYALGLMLFEMLTGQHPFKANTYQEWALQHCQQPVPMLPEVNAAFQPLIDGLLAKNTGYRFKVASEIEDTLKKIFY